MARKLIARHPPLLPFSLSSKRCCIPLQRAPRFSLSFNFAPDVLSTKVFIFVFVSGIKYTARRGNQLAIITLTYSLVNIERTRNYPFPEKHVSHTIPIGVFRLFHVKISLLYTHSVRCSRSIMPFGYNSARATRNCDFQFVLRERQIAEHPTSKSQEMP